MKHGFAFGEHIKTEKITKHRYKEGDSLLKFRGFFLPGVLVIVAIFLVVRLIFLQIVNGQEYKELADSNRTRTVIIHAPRGVIFDRSGIPLVFNIPGFIQVKKDENGKIVKTIHLNKEEALPKIAKGDRTIEVDSLRQYPYKESTSHVLGYIGQISEAELKGPNFSNYRAIDWIGKNG